jgi:hypothetical protein
VIKRPELILDTGRADKFCGGCGIREHVEVRADRAKMPPLGGRWHRMTGCLAGYDLVQAGLAFDAPIQGRTNIDCLNLVRDGKT